MEEHVFLNNEDILISSTRLVIDKKTIVMKSVCSIELDKEEVSPPWLLIGFTLFSLMIALISPNFSEIGWIFFLIGSVVTLITWFRKRKEGIIIELVSGQKIYLDNDKIDDLDRVFNVLNEVVIFRG
jgi:hypothetical protein